MLRDPNCGHIEVAIKIISTRTLFNDKFIRPKTEKSTKWEKINEQLTEQRKLQKLQQQFQIYQATDIKCNVLI